MISIAAWCRCAKFCAPAARDFRSQQCVFKRRRDEKDRTAEAVVTGSTCISCRSFLNSEKMLQVKLNERVLETLSFIFHTDTCSSHASATATCEQNGQSKEKGKSKQATLISDFHAHGSKTPLWPIRPARNEHRWRHNPSPLRFEDQSHTEGVRTQPGQTCFTP